MTNRYFIGEVFKHKNVICQVCAIRNNLSVYVDFRVLVNSDPIWKELHYFSRPLGFLKDQEKEFIKLDSKLAKTLYYWD